jgi:hypothetical protein
MKCCVFIVVMMCSAASWGQFYDGNRLLGLCQADAQTYEAGGCVGFIAGVSDSLGASKNQREASRRVCLSRGTTPEQLKKVVLDYLVLVPQLRGYDATFLVELALRAAYPCSA